MERLNFSIHINAARERVWQVLWGDDTYPQWTRPFGEGGRAETDWEEGSRVLFLSAEGDGMFGTIQRREDNAFLGIKHLGMYKDGREQPLDPTSREWSGAKEEYTLKESDGGTELSVAMDVTDDHKESFQKIFPAALGIVKELSEK